MRVVIIGLGCIAASIAAHDCNASAIISSGGVRLDITTGIFLPATATASVCLTNTLSGLVASPNTQFHVNGTEIIPPPPGAPCTIVVRGRGPLAGTYGGVGVLPLPKFPAFPLGRILEAENPAGRGIPAVGQTKSESRGLWSSIEDFFGVVRSAFHSSLVNVQTVGPAPPPATVISIVNDPWFFTPDAAVSVHIVATLESVVLAVDLSTDESGAASVDAFGAFGRGAGPGLPGAELLASWDFFHSIVDGGAFELPELTLLDRTFVLEPGTTYWLTSEIETAARFGSVPEPGTLILAGAGMLILVRMRRAGARALCR